MNRSDSIKLCQCETTSALGQKQTFRRQSAVMITTTYHLYGELSPARIGKQSGNCAPRLARLPFIVTADKGETSTANHMQMNRAILSLPCISIEWILLVIDQNELV